MSKPTGNLEEVTRASGNWVHKCLGKYARVRGTPDINLFASRVSNQVPGYFSYREDLFSRGQDAFQQSWKYLCNYAFPPFAVIGRVLKKLEEQNAHLLLVNPAWQSQAWYPRLPQLSVKT